MFLLKKVVVILLAVPITFFCSVVIHEYGHVLGAKIVGVESPTVYVWPGYELTPDFGDTYEYAWPQGAIAFSVHLPNNGYKPRLSGDLFDGAKSIPSLNLQAMNRKPAQINQTQYSVIALMGSTANLIVAFICALLLYQFRPKGAWFVILTCGSFLFYDMLFYAIFPVFFELRHLVFWGGPVAEPVIALSNLGLHENASVAIIIFVSVLQSWFLYQLSFNYKNNNKLSEFTVG